MLAYIAQKFFFFEEIFMKRMMRSELRRGKLLSTTLLGAGAGILIGISGMVDTWPASAQEKSSGETSSGKPEEARADDGSDPTSKDTGSGEDQANEPVQVTGSVTSSIDILLGDLERQLAADASGQNEDASADASSGEVAIADESDDGDRSDEDPVAIEAAPNNPEQIEDPTARADAAPESADDSSEGQTDRSRPGLPDLSDLGVDADSGVDSGDAAGDATGDAEVAASVVDPAEDAATDPDPAKDKEEAPEISIEGVQRTDKSTASRKRVRIEEAAGPEQEMEAPGEIADPAGAEDEESRESPGKNDDGDSVIAIMDGPESIESDGSSGSDPSGSESALRNEDTASQDDSPLSSILDDMASAMSDHKSGKGSDLTRADKGEKDSIEKDRAQEETRRSEGLEVVPSPPGIDPPQRPSGVMASDDMSVADISIEMDSGNDPDPRPSDVAGDSREKTDPMPEEITTPSEKDAEERQDKKAGVVEASPDRQPSAADSSEPDPAEDVEMDDKESTKDTDDIAANDMTRTKDPEGPEDVVVMDSSDGEDAASVNNTGDGSAVGSTEAADKTERTASIDAPTQDPSGEDSAQGDTSQQDRPVKDQASATDRQNTGQDQGGSEADDLAARYQTLLVWVDPQRRAAIWGDLSETLREDIRSVMQDAVDDYVRKIDDAGRKREIEIQDDALSRIDMAETKTERQRIIHDYMIGLHRRITESDFRKQDPDKTGSSSGDTPLSRIDPNVLFSSEDKKNDGVNP